jgi:nitrogenase molybdenum-iron protein alpha/beta subunit
MKGLWKYISPFAPDQSGAAAVLYELGGIIVICDAGGCAGNVCGFDEPRWFTGRSAIFSAGLRDMDAILGRDDKLIEKLCHAAAQIDASFAAIIGTPVPSVIGTDYKALQRMAEKKLDLPIVTIDTTGMQLYDNGSEKAWLALFETFAAPVDAVEAGTLAVIGATPLDLNSLDAGQKLQQQLTQEGWQKVICYGMGATLDDIRQAGRAAKNLVVAPAGLQAAQFLQDRFGTPYEVRYPLVTEPWQTACTEAKGKKILVIHQQVLANSLRTALRQHGAAAVTVATWFQLKDELKEEQDIALAEEDDLIQLVQQGGFDMILGDGSFKKALPFYEGTYIDVPHFAVSGRM